MWKLGCILLIGIALLHSSLAVDDYRLPLHVVPVNYNIRLRPYLLSTDGAKRFTFDGIITIEISVVQSTNLLVMHSKNLNYTARYIWSETNVTRVNLRDPNVDSVTDKLTYTLSEALIVGRKYYLHFEYSGILGDDMYGFYRSYYNDTSGATKWLASTQFQPVHARRAFPCFDEPKFKATFKVWLTRPKYMNTFSNTRIINQTSFSENNLDYEIDEYEKTPIMSSYLLAFIVSEFREHLNTQQNFGIIAQPDLYDQTAFCLQYGENSLDYLQNYLGTNYYEMGVEKMHMAALPDFSAGAMENWGLLTYRERALLYAEGDTSLSYKQSIANIITHEQAHQWFGDLVTCDWWSYTWLNEGFATYFQYFGTDKIEPSFDFGAQFVTNPLQTVMNMDSLNGSNPLSDENTNTPGDISRMFNDITYSKGACFIRSVNHIIGEQNFARSLQEYLKNYSYKSTVPQNLLSYWNQYWPSEFSSFGNSYFKSFTEQVGYPVITVKLASDGNSFTVKQKRFLLKPEDGADSSILYVEPISFTTSKQKDFTTTAPSFFLPAQSTEMTKTLNERVDWIIVNIQEAFYYRVNYDESNWHALHHALQTANWGGIHVLNRGQIVDDLFNLAYANDVSYSFALPILEYLSTETHYQPWNAAFTALNYLQIRLGTNHSLFGQFIRDLTEKAYKTLGFEERSSDSSLDIFLRSLVLSWNCKFGNEDCIQQAKQYFQKILQTKVPVNIRTPVYCAVMQEGSENDFETLYQKYLTETVATEKALIINSLGCVKNPTLVERFFNIILGDTIRLQDKSSAMLSLYSSNNENVMPVFRLITRNYEQVSKAFGSYSTPITTLANMAAYFTEESQLNELQQFNRQYKSNYGTYSTALDQAEKTVRINLKWNAERLGEFTNYLENRSHSGSSAIIAKSYVILSLSLMCLVSYFLN